MAKPVILKVDDDAEVLRAIERDLRRKYAETYRVLRADSGSAGARQDRAFRSDRKLICVKHIGRR